MAVQIKEEEVQARFAAIQFLNQAVAGFAGQQSLIGRTLGLFNIAIASGKAIAKGTAAAQGVPFPGNLVAVATTIGTVLSNITQTRLIYKPGEKFKERSNPQTTIHYFVM